MLAPQLACLFYFFDRFADSTGVYSLIAATVVHVSKALIPIASSLITRLNVPSHYQKSVTWALRRRRNRSTWLQQGSTRCMAFGISRPSSVESCDLKTVKMVVDLSDLLHSGDFDVV